MGRVNRRIGKSSETANVTADGTGGGVLDAFLQEYFNRSGNVFNAPGAVPDSGITATGGVISDYTDPGSGNVYRAHVFTSTGTLNVTARSNTFPNTIDYLLVAGGGGTGLYAGGGAGGAFVSTLSAGVDTYTITVGGGGEGYKITETNNIMLQTELHQQYQVQISPLLLPMVAVVVPSTSGSGDPGGSGGGGGYPSLSGGTGNKQTGTSTNIPSPLQPQGYDGGDGAAGAPNYGGGGGGGAGGVGSNGTPTAGGAGGVGISNLYAGPSNDGVGAPGPSPGRWLLVEVAEEVIREVLVLVVEEDQQHLPMLEVVLENLVHLTLEVMME